MLKSGQDYDIGISEFMSSSSRQLDNWFNMWTNQHADTLVLMRGPIRKSAAPELTRGPMIDARLSYKSESVLTNLFTG